MDPIFSLYSALSADAALAALLGEYGGEPAIFSADKLPSDVDPSALFHIQIGPAPVHSRDHDTFSTFAREAEIDVRIFRPASEDSADLDEAAEAARACLHRQTLPAPSGGSAPFATVSGPVIAPTSGPDIAGRRLAVRLTWRE